MDHSSTRFAFWLLPGVNERTFFASLVRDLALRFDAPIFEPHLTLHGGILNEGDARKILSNVPTDSNYELEVDALHISERFTKTLFVRFQLSDELNELRRAIGEELQLPELADFDPHLSLLYKEMERPKKKELRDTIAIPFQRVRFTGLSLIAHPAEITTREDVEAWRTLAQRSFTESSR